MKGIGTQENRDIAFEVFKLFGGRGVGRMLDRLKWEHNIEISDKTLYEWKTEGGWEERLNAEAAGPSEILTVREKMLGSILALIEKHERQFSEEGAVADAQATYAYTNLVRAAAELAAKLRNWESARHAFVRQKPVGPAKAASVPVELSALPVGDVLLGG